MKISEEFRKIVEKEFKGLTGKIILILNDGGIRDGSLEVKLK